MELYQRARPDILSGKKLLYVHGFASSGSTGTVRTLKTLLPDTGIIAPDLPPTPNEAYSLLQDVCSREKPDVIVGTSMGGMLAERLHGFDRVLVNPAFSLADTIMKNYGLGRVEYHNKRADGQTSFLVTKGLLEEFREFTSHCFESCGDPIPGLADSGDGSVYGLFGKRDTLVDSFGDFSSHYGAAIRFDGQHSLDDSTVLHSLLPVLQWIDDKQEGRVRKTVLICFKGVMDKDSSSPKGFRALSERYSPFIVDFPSPNDPASGKDVCEWADLHIGVPAWNRIISSPRADMLLGDYLITRGDTFHGEGDFMGTVLQYGKEPLRTWEEVIGYFEKLNGQ